MSLTGLQMQPTIHFRKKVDILISILSFFGIVVWVAFSILSGSLSLVKYPVYNIEYELKKKKKSGATLQTKVLKT
jgi:hypothetical protein